MISAVKRPRRWRRSPGGGSPARSVLRLAGDAGHLGDVFRRLAHRFGAVELLHARVGVAPAQGGVVGGQVAKGIGAFGLGQRIGRARHALDAAGDEDLAFAAADGARRHVDRRQPGGAQPVDGHPGGFNGQPGQQGGHARHVAVVFAGLVGAAEVDLLDQPGVDSGAVEQAADDECGQVVGAHFGQHAAQRSDRRADGIDDDGFGHGVVSPTQFYIKTKFPIPD